MAGATRLRVNGAERRVSSRRGRSLLSVLRDELGLTGAKYGCGEGQCGACTVVLGDRAVRACVTAVEAAAGREVRTVEGLATGDRLHPLQQAFIEAGALQCGYCTPGMIMAAHALLARNPDPGDDEIRRGLQGNICRCGAYARIVAAVRGAAAAMRTR
jgi:aerobic-type carbon monoxide dehydrogenase small subunit (CoxS/CutS family)